ncbi:MAG TPA: PEP-utilizing enzyme [Dehalococcoidia bacterium]|nr:PEP-utilizing enzyme [Dehalococcoidia bacterium]
MVAAELREFPVAWRRPEDAEKLWAWDGMHCPRPLTPLSIEFAVALARSGVFEDRGASPDDPPVMFVNGYFYQRFQPPDPNAATDPRTQAAERRAAEEAPRVARLWQRRWLPQIRRVCREILATDYDAMSTAELQAALRRAIDRAGRAFALTLRAAAPMSAGVQNLYEFCEKEFGPEGVALAGESIQGYNNASFAADAALWQVARRAEDLGLASLLLSSPPERLPTALEALPAGRELLAALRTYLNRFGWRTPTWWELSEPPWREAPQVALTEVARILREGIEDPRLKARAVIARRRAALRRIRARLEGAKRAEFDALWRTAKQFVPVSEGRALWQLSLSGYLRLPALALGRALVRDGALDDQNDIFYLSLDDLSSGDPAGWRTLVAERRRDRDRWRVIVPPMTIGRMPPPPPAEGGADQAGTVALPFGVRMVSGFGAERSADERLLKGNAASPGVASGRACVAETVEAAERLQPGDILVCRFTTPSWAHLFSRAAAIVADSGGVLSHCAILAREYGIPCVAGVRVATRRIRDGMMLTVDGTQGIVRLED